ncbi:hypothetical protein ACIGKQ_16410 [Gordonia sp. NPDC062954]|uniref:hypothetical protein n=1 Tax=Gordonia sp. NPDC062954 TaxID=3364003 RepID=UPI0037CC2503
MTADPNRYATLDSHADAGLGADEPGICRFTRPCERAELHQAQLDRLADEAWERMDEARGTDRFDRLRDLAAQAKDDADAFGRSVDAAQRVLRGPNPPTSFQELVDRTATADDRKTPPTSTAKHHVEGNTNDHERTTDV